MDKSTPTQLKTLLTDLQLSIAVAESITSGRLQAALGSVSGSSAYFQGGITAYNLRQKTTLLHIDGEHAASVNCVSQRVADELAAQVCKLFAADIGLATTGYAEPCPAFDIDTPHAYISICRMYPLGLEYLYKEKIIGYELGRVDMQEWVSTCTLQALLNYLLLGTSKNRNI